MEQTIGWVVVSLVAAVLVWQASTHLGTKKRTGRQSSELWRWTILSRWWSHRAKRWRDLFIHRPKSRL
ncbi:MAG: hypothetical protein Ct9H90mP16_11380 [Candidatus Poseidoniales archaeon]|nr:MAG: hypothetical protein Ct9H90mP16_11380 [Candidatus Poseidoniales archaeon]